MADQPPLPPRQFYLDLWSTIQQQRDARRSAQRGGGAGDSAQGGGGGQPEEGGDGGGGGTPPTERQNYRQIPRALSSALLYSPRFSRRPGSNSITLTSGRNPGGSAETLSEVINPIYDRAIDTLDPRDRVYLFGNLGNVLGFQQLTAPYSPLGSVSGGSVDFDQSAGSLVSTNVSEYGDSSTISSSGSGSPISSLSSLSAGSDVLELISVPPPPPSSTQSGSGYYPYYGFDSSDSTLIPGEGRGSAADILSISAPSFSSIRSPSFPSITSSFFDSDSDTSGLLPDHLFDFL